MHYKRRPMAHDSVSTAHSKVNETASNDANLDAVTSWIRLGTERGALAVLTTGGTIALYRGLFPTFDLHEAVFGAAALFAVGVIEMVIWIMKYRAAEGDVRRAEEAAERAREKRDKVGKASPGSRPVTAEELVPGRREDS
jgi:hypothetical protein